MFSLMKMGILSSLIFKCVEKAKKLILMITEELFIMLLLISLQKTMLIKPWISGLLASVFIFWQWVKHPMKINRSIKKILFKFVRKMKIITDYPLRNIQNNSRI